MRVSWKHYRKNALGFTLLELLVVIAIIGIISSATVVNLNQAKAKARDARRLSDITQLRKALEIYYYTVGEYPNAGPDDPLDQYDKVCYGLSAVGGCNSTTPNPNKDWIPDLTNQTGQLPVDPINIVGENVDTSYLYLFTRTDSEAFPNPSYKDYYYILYRLETQDPKDECGLPDPLDDVWSCKGGGDLP